MNPKKELVVKAIENGTVIDHIPADRTLLVVEMLTHADDFYLVGVNLLSSSVGKKGIIKLENRTLDERDLQILASLAPQATVNVIKGYEITEKIKLVLPDVIVGLFKCANKNCISSNEPVVTRFLHSKNDLRCHYCERTFPVHRLKIHRPAL